MVTVFVSLVVSVFVYLGMEFFIMPMLTQKPPPCRQDGSSQALVSDAALCHLRPRPFRSRGVAFESGSSFEASRPQSRQDHLWQRRRHLTRLGLATESSPRNLPSLRLPRRSHPQQRVAARPKKRFNTTATWAGRSPRDGPTGLRQPPSCPGVGKRRGNIRGPERMLPFLRRSDSVRRSVPQVRGSASSPTTPPWADGESFEPLGCEDVLNTDALDRSSCPRGKATRDDGQR